MKICLLLTLILLSSFVGLGYKPLYIKKAPSGITRNNRNNRSGYATLKFKAGFNLPYFSQTMSQKSFVLLDIGLQDIFNIQASDLANEIQRQHSLGRMSAAESKSKSAWELIQNKISPHLIASAVSDPEGAGIFRQIKPGNYYLVYTGFLDDPPTSRMIVWNVSIKLKAGKNSIILDRNNAALARAVY